MKKYWILLMLLPAVALLAYHYSLISFLLIIPIGLCTAVLLFATVLKLIRKRVNHKWVRIPLVITIICLVGILTSLLKPLPPATVDTDEVSEALAYAYQTDQGDRKNLKFYTGLFAESRRERDSLRMDQAMRLYKNQQITKPLDKFHAAFIFHHGSQSQQYEIAHQLANEAAEAEALLDVYLVQWLAKATYDRWMLSLGKPQKYDTQKNTLEVNVR